MFSACFLRSTRTRNTDKAPVCSDDNTYVDPPQFTLRLLTAATGNFAAKNKLGLGGVQQERSGEDLGLVFKGKLEDGQVVAVRRLHASHWESSRFHELKDELLLATKLKHDNMVQLLGFCLEQPEKLLVYEYLPNASLDTILFDPDRRRRHLDWEKRHSIISGIARGLMQLHEESGQRIYSKGILRPSKILLDKDMKPKILDTGVISPNTKGRRTFWSHNIHRYAAPEWIVTCGTTKSDMFSFGVILLEMVAGRGMYYDWCNATAKGLNPTGLAYVWDKWKARLIADIADPSLGHGYSRNEMRNCVHIGLLCLQHDPGLRPHASLVLQALETSCPKSLPNPSGPYGSYLVCSMP